MDIYLNANSGVNRAANTGLSSVQEAIAEKSDELKGGGIHGPALTVTERQLTGLEALDEYEEVDLRRDDTLGKLVMAAFDLKAPEIPDFV